MTTNTELLFFNESNLAEALPNLDGFLDPEDMVAFIAECKRVESALATLRGYAEAKGHAMQLRLWGRIEDARRFEAAMESKYAQLPEWAKW